MDSTPYVLRAFYAVGVPATKHAQKPTEFERLMKYRFEELLAVGLAPDQAIALIEKPDIVHEARNLAVRGCPPQIIAKLLGD